MIRICKECGKKDTIPPYRSAASKYGFCFVHQVANRRRLEFTATVVVDPHQRLKDLFANMARPRDGIGRRPRFKISG